MTRTPPPAHAPDPRRADGREVDPHSRNAILESVEALSGEGMAVLYTTHHMEEAERLCDRIAIIDSGWALHRSVTRAL